MNKFMKSVALYIAFMFILYHIKPEIFYTDCSKTQLKKWDAYKQSRNIKDIITIYSVVVSLVFLLA